MTTKELSAIINYAQVAYECEVQSLEDRIEDVTIVEQNEYFKIIFTYITEFSVSQEADTGYVYDATDRNWFTWLKTESLRKLHEELFETFNGIAR